METVGRFIASIFAFKPCHRAKKSGRPNSEQYGLTTEQLLTQFPPDTEQSLQSDLNDVVAMIDNATKQSLRAGTPSCRAQPADRENGNNNAELPGYRCNTANVDSNGIIALINSNTDEDSTAIELADLRSFDYETAIKFKDFNCKDLGRHHSSMHVRSCNSKTCDICQKEERVYFVKTKKPDFISVGWRQ